MKEIIYITLFLITIFFFFCFKHDLTIKPFSYKIEFDMFGFGWLLIVIGVITIRYGSYKEGKQQGLDLMKEAVIEHFKDNKTK